MNNDIQSFGAILPLLLEGAEITRQSLAASNQLNVVFVEYNIEGIPKMFMRFNDGRIDRWLPTDAEMFANDWHVLRYN